MWYSNECKFVLITYLWGWLIGKKENLKHFQNLHMERTGNSLWDNIQDITESELGLLALILLPVLPSFIHDFRFTFYINLFIMDVDYGIMQDPLKQIHLYVKYFLVTNYNSWISVGFIHAGSFFTNKQAPSGGKLPESCSFLSKKYS